jgi:hypothetical protein
MEQSQAFRLAVVKKKSFPSTGGCVISAAWKDALNDTSYIVKKRWQLLDFLRYEVVPDMFIVEGR